MDVAVTNIQSEMTVLKDKVKTNYSREASTDVHFKCKICEKSFVRGNELRSHIASTHRQGVKCKQCDKQFLNNYVLENHLQEHGTPKKYKCENCDKTFHFKWRLERHTEMHSDSGSVRTCHYFNNAKVCPFEKNWL